MEPENSVHSLDATIANFALSPTRAYPGEPMTFYVNASSTVIGATVNITIYFDYLLSDGVTVNPASPVYSEYSMETPANLVTSYTYDHIGNLTDATGTYFRTRAVVYDGYTYTERLSKAYVVGNTAPTLTSKPAPIIHVDYNESKNMSFIVHDMDSELVTVTWDFGDGTDPVVNETIATPEGSYILQNHTWVVTLEPGRDSRDESNPYYVLFNMSVSFVDAVGNTKYSNHTVNVTPPNNEVPSIDFWVQSNYWSPGYDLPIYASATDPEGDPITWTYIFNDSVEDYLVEVYHSDPTDCMTVVWNNITHMFSSVGIYYITLYVSDALPPYQINKHNLSAGTIKVTVLENKAPGVLANITVTPSTIPRINTTTGYVEVKFSIQANDPDGDVLYLGWDFGDGELGENVSLGGIQVYTFSQVHRYYAAGQYNVSVVVDDNRGHTVLRYKLVTVYSNNSGPRLTMVDFDLSNGVFALPGSIVNVTIVISDAERDPLTIWLDFGDGSPVSRIDSSEFAEDNTITVLQSHVYNATGEYNVTITYTDWVFGPSHNESVELKIVVRVPRIIVARSWNWWDYTSLALVIAGVGLVFLRWVMIWRLRNELDEKGLTYEEYRLLGKNMRKERNESLKKIRVQVREGKIDRIKAKSMKSRIKSDYRGNREQLRAGTWVEVEDGA